MRNSKTEPKEIMEDVRSTIHNQIMKQVILYYAANLKSANIKMITIERFDDNQLVEEVCEYTSEDEPLRNLHWQKGIIFDTNILKDGILNHFEDFGNIISYWLTSVTSNDIYIKFENLWRCFERLSYKNYRGMSDHPREKDTLKDIRNFIRNNPNLFPVTSNYVHNINPKEFRDNYEWRLMLYNDFKRGGSKSSYNLYKEELVMPYTDLRVIKMLNDTLVYRAKDLKRLGLYNEIVNHLSTYTSRRITKDADLIAILCGTYASYMRNKIFHGEILSRYISLSYNLEDKIITNLNNILELLDFELINKYNLLGN